METRAFISELSAVDINSPGEHGVAYTMGCGFFRDPLPDSPEAAGTARERANAQSRNLGLVQRINAALPEVAIDIERDLKVSILYAVVVGMTMVLESFVLQAVVGIHRKVLISVSGLCGMRINEALGGVVVRWCGGKENEK